MLFLLLNSYMKMWIKHFKSLENRKLFSVTIQIKSTEHYFPVRYCLLCCTRWF